MPRDPEREMKARALQMASETLPDHGNKTEACRHMGGLLGIGPGSSPWKWCNG